MKCDDPDQIEYSVAHTGELWQLCEKGQILANLPRVRPEIQSIFDFLCFYAIFSWDRVDLASSNNGGYWSQHPKLPEYVSIFAVAQKLKSGALGATEGAQRIWGHNFGIFSQFSPIKNRLIPRKPDFRPQNVPPAHFMTLRAKKTIDQAIQNHFYFWPSSVHFC